MTASDAHITLYHGAWCRSLRVRWLLEELGVPYKLVKMKYDPTALQAPEYLRVHPLGQLPALTYNDITVWESTAIMEFLLSILPSKKLTPPQAGTAEQARYLQFFHFSESLMAPVSAIVAAEYDQKCSEHTAIAAAEAKPNLARRLKYLDAEFAQQQPYILGEHFSAADIMLGYTLAAIDNMTQELKEASKPYPHVRAYLSVLQHKPSYKAAFEDEYNVD